MTKLEQAKKCQASVDCLFGDNAWDGVTQVHVINLLLDDLIEREESAERYGLSPQMFDLAKAKIQADTPGKFITRPQLAEAWDSEIAGKAGRFGRSNGVSFNAFARALGLDEARP